MVTLNKPSAGNTDWASDVNTNWTSIETELNNLGKDIGCRVQHASAQTINSGSTANLAWDTENWDTDSMHDTVTNNDRITFKTAGKFLVVVNVTWSVSFSANRCITALRDQTGGYIGQIETNPGASTYPAHSVSVIVNATVNDYVYAAVYQDSGSSRTVESSGRTSFMAQKIDKGG